jgi:hypothetical protein
MGQDGKHHKTVWWQKEKQRIFIGDRPDGDWVEIGWIVE